MRYTGRLQILRRGSRRNHRHRASATIGSPWRKDRLCSRFRVSPIPPPTSPPTSDHVINPPTSDCFCSIQRRLRRVHPAPSSLVHDITVGVQKSPFSSPKSSASIAEEVVAVWKYIFHFLGALLALIILSLPLVVLLCLVAYVCSLVLLSGWVGLVL
ncbi:hypothetical protein L2E82_08085 [Cichorium intybus]|uniref:Uncharacterized protein n=1 Tax=Cichorium intybus TaxID=13427 RepID=A0ACB9G5K9_CICIN|nr:hypothetical protein L2E82_08085 [Cichorium intybus]